MRRVCRDRCVRYLLCGALAVGGMACNRAHLLHFLRPSDRSARSQTYTMAQLVKRHIFGSRDIKNQRAVAERVQQS